MARSKINKIDWITVFDGAKALIFENAGFPDAPDLKLIEKREINVPPDRDLKTAPAGRRSGNDQTPASTMEETNLHDQQEGDFVRALAEALNGMARDERFDQLFVMGAPEAMGDFRNALSNEASGRIVAEVTGDYVNHTVKDLEAMVKAAVS